MTTTKPLCLTGGAHVMYCIAAVLLALLLPVQTMADEAWAEYNSNDSTLTFKYGTKPESSDEGITLYALNVDTVSPGWNDEALNIKSVVLEPSFANARPTSCYAWFKNCANLTSLDLTNLNTEAVTNMSWMFGIDNNCYDEYGSALESITWPETLDTKNVKDMSCMFYNCDSLTTLDVSKFNTENVENMTSMFDCCSGLETLEVTNFNTAKVRDMNCMFACCSSLTTLNVSNFNTEKVTNMYSMFYNCSSLTTLNLSNFNTESVEDMSYMFEDCSGLTTLNVSSFNTANVTDMSRMFNNCSSLTSLDLSGFNTENVKGMVNMFTGCSSLTSLNVSNFNTANVWTMDWMFYRCSGLTSIDLTSFDTNNVKYMDYMFASCSKLATVYVGEKFFIKTAKEPLGMFDDCAEEGAKYYYIKTYYRVGDTKYELWSKSGTFSVDELVLEDGKDFVAHVPFTAATASYQRTMANRWGTLCLPFAVETSAATGCTFYGLESVTGDLITLTLLDGTIAAGTPVFVNSSSGSISISASNAAVVTTPAAGTESGWQLVGSYTATDVPDDGYIISNNKFWLASDLKNGSTSAAVKTKGLRAWLKAGATGSEARANTLDIFAGDDATSIDAMEGLADGTAEIYDTQGRRTDRLQKGLNIVKTGGVTKKVMVK